MPHIVQRQWHCALASAFRASERTRQVQGAVVPEAQQSSLSCHRAGVVKASCYGHHSSGSELNRHIALAMEVVTETLQMAWCPKHLNRSQ